MVTRRLLTAATVVLLLVAAPALAQEPPADVSLPADLVAPLSLGDAEAPELAATALYLTPADDASPAGGDVDPVVAVGFREPFDAPGEPWRVSVLFGEPAGDHQRASLVRAGGVDEGRIESADGTPLRPTEVHVDPSGMVFVTLPGDELAAAPAVTVEVARAEGAEHGEVRRAPWFPRAALFGEGPPGRVPGNPYGELDGEAVAVGRPPVLTVRDGIAMLDWEAALPTEVAEQPVARVIDRLHLAGDLRSALAGGAVVEFDRLRQEVRLLEDVRPAPEDRTGDRRWLIEAPQGVGPGHALVDVPAALAAAAGGDDPPGGAPVGGEEGAGGEPVDPAVAALGVSRVLILEDGRTVTASPVMAAPGWLALAVDAELPDADAVAQPVAQRIDTRGTDRTLLLVGAGALAAVLVGLAALAGSRRARRGAEPDADRGDPDREDPDRVDGPDADGPDADGPDADGPDADGRAAPDADPDRAPDAAGGVGAPAGEAPVGEAPVGEAPPRRRPRAPAGVRIDAERVTDLAARSGPPDLDALHDAVDELDERLRRLEE